MPRTPRARAGSLLLAALLPLLALPSCGGEAGPGQRVVLVVVDTLRFDGLFGPDAPMRRLADRAAREGLVFPRCYATTSSTQPTHATLFTGLEPWQHGVTRNGEVLLPERTTLAERLSAAGWSTAAVVASYPVTAHFGFDQGFDEFREVLEEGRKRKARTWDEDEPPAWDAFYGLSPDVTDAALSVLDGLDGPRQFLWVHYFDPHSPYGDDVLPEKQRVETKHLTWAAQLDDPQGLGLLMRRARTLYDRDLQTLDQQLDRLLTRLDRDGDRWRTSIVITADHGESFGDDGSFGHGDRLTPQQVHVPLVVIAPGVPPGQRDETAGTIDLTATLAALAGLPPDPGGGGRDLLGPAPTADPVALGMRRSFERPGIDVRVDGTILKPDGPLFYLVRDGVHYVGDGRSVEAVEGVADAAVAEQARRAFALFEGELAGVERSELTDPETVSALEALGYVR